MEQDILPAARELGVALVAYAPLGRRLLPGGLTTVDALAADDIRRQQPRFLGDNLTANLGLVDRVRTLASEAGCTPAQLSPAWLLGQGPDVIPLPGMRRRTHLRENAGAVGLTLPAALLRAVAQAVGEAAGARAPDMTRLEK
ncbi:aldo/keto reductase [Streptomyces sp. NPDC059989]|uniref:aldo/keto reductase n=1 Tax=Streptomyces sp. NPDC059989 TaxID=3347026 RepID=UPI0036B6CA55